MSSQYHTFLNVTDKEKSKAGLSFVFWIKEKKKDSYYVHISQLIKCNEKIDLIN